MGGSVLLAQDATLVPSIRTELATATNDTLRADALARLCFNLINTNPDSARHCGEQALDLANRIGNARAIADAHNNLGWLETQQGHMAEATEHLEIALEGFRRIGNPVFTSITLSNMGWLADKQGDRTAALKYFGDALEQATLAADSASMAVLLYSIGTTYNRMKEYGRARTFLERSLVIEEQLGRRNSQGNCLVAIGNAWRSDGEATRAMDHYQQASALFHATSNHYGAGMVQENSGDLFLESDPEKALPYYQRALAHYDTIHSAADKAYILQRIGLANTGMKKYAEAEAAYTEGMALADQSSSTELMMDLHLSLAELAVKQGKSEVAIGHYQRHMALKDSLRSEASEQELMRLRATFETEQAEQENALLKAENALSRANEAKMKARWTAAAAISAGLVLLLALLYRNYRQRGKHTKEVERFNAELQAQRDQVQHMNDLLELKILRSQLNPHFIHNCQNSAMAMVKEGRNEEALAYLQGLSKLMRMVLEHSVNDRITVEEEMAFLRLYVKLESLRMPGLECEVVADRELLDEEAALPALLVQPFVENALLHGLAQKEGPRRLSIRFSATENGLRCVVRDNGRGRSGAGTKPNGQRSLGTELTNERLQLLTHRLQQKGRFTIHDLKDDAGGALGTEVIIDLEG
ncbi:MAG: tetratricopeptide repeat protein [Flavobacteriales bacterium]|nr:tetratricopeptide repeat protein [Flavobacteriales bacterium]HPF89563.1 tetratricopeptide repeat protein [Flavobacteriales bacterium]